MRAQELGKFDERKFTKLRKTSFSDVLWLCLHWRICVPPVYTYGYCVYSRAFIRPDSSEVVHALVFRNGTGAEEGRRLKENRNDCHFDESKNFSLLLFANVFSHLSNYTPNRFWYFGYLIIFRKPLANVLKNWLVFSAICHFYFQSENKKQTDCTRIVTTVQVPGINFWIPSNSRAVTL